jgi:hypothetical protein
MLTLYKCSSCSHNCIMIVNKTKDSYDPIECPIECPNINGDPNWKEYNLNSLNKNNEDYNLGYADGFWAGLYKNLEEGKNK